MFIPLFFALNKRVVVAAAAPAEDLPTTSYRVYVANETDTIATYDRAFLEDTHSLKRYDNYSYGGSTWNTDIYTDSDGQGKYWELGKPLRSNGGQQPGVFNYWIYAADANALQPTASTSYVDQGPSGYHHAHNYALFLHLKLHSVPSDIATDTNHIMHQWFGSSFAYQLDWVSGTQIVVKGKTSGSSFTTYSNNITIAPTDYNRLCMVVNKNSGQERIAFFLNGEKKFDSSDSSAGVGHATTLGTAVTDLLTGYRTGSSSQQYLFILRDISGTAFNTPAKMKDLRLFNQVLTDAQAVSITADPALVGAIVTSTYSTDADKKAACTFALANLDTYLHSDFTFEFSVRNFGGTSLPFGFGLSPITSRNPVNTEAYFYIAGWGTASASCVGDFNSTTITIASFDMTSYSTSDFITVKIEYDESNSGHFQLYLNGAAIGSGVSSTWSAHSGLTNFAVGYRPLVSHDGWVADLQLKDFAFTAVEPASVAWAGESSAGFPNWAPYGSNNTNLNSIPLFTTSITTTSSTGITIDSASPLMPLSCAYYTRPFFPATIDYDIEFTVTMGTSGEWQMYFHHTDNTLTDNGSTGRPAGGAAYTWTHAASWSDAKNLLNIYNSDSTTLQVKRFRDGVDASIDPAIYNVTHSGTISVEIKVVSGVVTLSVNNGSSTYSTTIDAGSYSHNVTPPPYYLAFYSKVTDLTISNLTINSGTNVSSRLGGGSGSTPTHTIDVFRVIDSINGRTRPLEVELLSGGTKVTNLVSTTVYQYTDGTNPTTGVLQNDRGNHGLITDGYKTGNETTNAGLSGQDNKFLTYFRGGVSPKLLYRFVVNQSENVDGIASYYTNDQHIPGIKIEKNGVVMYQNAVVPITSHQETYTSSYSDTSTFVTSNFGTMIPNTFGSPTVTYTTTTPNTQLTSVAAYRKSSVFRLKGSITSTTTNTLFEFGGAGRGMACYMHSGTLYVQCGAGGSVGGQLELSHAVGASDTIIDIVVSLSSSTVNSGTCSLFVNLVKVDTGTYPSTTDVIGTNTGGIGQKHSAMPTTRMGAGGASDGIHALQYGTITSVEAWGDKFINNP